MFLIYCVFPLKSRWHRSINIWRLSILKGFWPLQCSKSPFFKYTLQDSAPLSGACYSRLSSTIFHNHALIVCLIDLDSKHLINTDLGSASHIQKKHVPSCDKHTPSANMSDIPSHSYQLRNIWIWQQTFQCVRTNIPHSFRWRQLIVLTRGLITNGVWIFLSGLFAMLTSVWKQARWFLIGKKTRGRFFF